MDRRRNKSQTFAEYALLIAVTVGALIAMRVYVVRVVQQKYRESADVFGQGEQYASGRTLITNLDGGTIHVNREIPARDTCIFVAAEADRLKRRINELNAKAGSLEQASADALEQVPILQQEAATLKSQAANFRNQASQKEAQVASLTSDVASLRVQAQRTQDKIDKYKSEYSECFSFREYFPEGCDWVKEEVGRLEGLKVNLLAEANTKEQDAITKDAEARSLTLQADAKDEAAAAKEMEARRLQVISDESLLSAARYRQEADTKSARVSRYKVEHPGCFDIDTES